MSNKADQIFNSKPATGPFAAGPDAASLADRAALGLLLVSVFFLPSDLRIAGGKSLVLISGYGSLLFALYAMIRRRSWMPPTLGLMLLAAFVLWSAGTLAWARYPAEGLWKIGQYCRLLPLAWLVTQYTWSNRLRHRLYDAYIAGCWLGFIGLVHGFVSGVSYAAESDEFAGRYSFGTDPNYLALALVMGIPFACHRAVSAESRWLRRVSIWYVPAAVLAVALTGSRGGMIALLAAACGYAIWSTGRTRLLILSGIAVLLLVAFAAPFIPAQRFRSIPQELLSGTLADRKDLWIQGIAAVKEYPIAGMGVGTPEGLLSDAAHDTPLEVLMAGGIISLLLFYGPFALAVARLRRKLTSERKPLLIACVVWFVGTTALSWDNNTISWFLLAVLWSIPATKRSGEVVAPAAREDYDPASWRGSPASFSDIQAPI